MTRKVLILLSQKEPQRNFYCDIVYTEINNKKKVDQRRGHDI